MLSRTIAFELVALATIAGVARAEPRDDQRHDNQRTRGTVARERQSEPANARTNPAREQTYHSARTGREERHGVVLEHRPASVVEHDRYAHTFTRGYHARHDWDHFYPQGGWLASWNLGNWNTVGNVTCEAADEATGALYPVTAPRDGVWNDGTVNAVLDQALDECAADTNAQQCVPATPSCSFTGP